MKKPHDEDFENDLEFNTDNQADLDQASQDDIYEEDIFEDLFDDNDNDDLKSSEHKKNLKKEFYVKRSRFKGRT